METLPDDTTAIAADRTGSGGLKLSPLRALTAAVAVLVVAALVLALVEWSDQRDKANRLARQAGLSSSAAAAARSYGLAFGSYDYRDLTGPNASWTIVEAHSDAKFRSDYQRLSGALAPTVVALKATATAAIPHLAVESVTSSKAVVIMLLSQQVTNATQANGNQKQQYMLAMTLVRQNGQWLIDDVKASV
ncbi:MAG TPA: hypothetical protein VKI19_03500 [Acidimicrobiales bacterium]|nr:hypothetical protein [Acidimicrobiales bacterium]